MGKIGRKLGAKKGRKLIENITGGEFLQKNF
jgi:hypothetical protein